MAHICGRLGWEGAHDFAESEDKNGHLEKENITQGGWDIHGTQRWTQGRKLQKRMKKQDLIDINSDNADETKLIAGLRSQSLDKAGTKLLPFWRLSAYPIMTSGQRPYSEGRIFGMMSE